MEAQDESLSSSSVGSSGTTASIDEPHAASYDVTATTNHATETSPKVDYDNKRNSTINIMETVEDKTVGIDNPGFDDDDEKKEIQETPKTSKSKNGKSNNGVFLNSPGVDTSMLTEVNLSQNGSDIKDKEMAEAVNLELVNMSPYKAGEKEGVHGIPVKKENGGEGGSGNYHDAYDEYFVPVNEHRKYMRGEKLYVTKDKRRPESRKKCICWGVGFVIIAVAILIAVLAGTGVILSNEENVILNESSSRQLGGSDVKAAGFGNLPGKRPGDVPSTPSPASTTIGLQPPSTDMTPLYVPRVIEGEMVIDNEEFIAALADRESTEFKELSAALEEELKNALFDQSTLNYGSADIFVKVLDFSSGSIVVKYRVGWVFKDGIRNPPDPIEKDALRQRLETHLGRLGGFLDKYHLTTGSVRASSVINNCQFNNGDCSHDCVFDYKSHLNFMCTCPEGFELDESGKKCHSDHEPSAEPEATPEPTSEPNSEEPKSEPEPSSEEPKSEPEPTSEEPKSEPEPSSEEPKSEPEPTSEEPKSEPEPSSEEPKAEPEPSSEEPKAEPEPSSGEPKSEPEPTSEEPKSEPEPTSEEPKAEPEPTSEKPKSEPEPNSDKEPKSEPEPTSEPNAEPEPSHKDGESTETMFGGHMHKDNDHEHKDTHDMHEMIEHDHKDHDHKDHYHEDHYHKDHDHKDHDHKDHDHKHNMEDKATATTISPEQNKDTMFEHKDSHHLVGSMEHTTMKQDGDKIGVTEKEESAMKADDHVGMTEMESSMKKDVDGVIVGVTDMPMEHTTINEALLLEVDEAHQIDSKELEMMKEHKSKNKGSDEKKLLGHWDEHTTMREDSFKKELKNKTIVDFVKEFGVEKKQGKKNATLNFGEDPRLELTTILPVISMDGDFWDSINTNGDQLKERIKMKNMKSKEKSEMEELNTDGGKSKEEMIRNENEEDKENMDGGFKESINEENKKKKENKIKNQYWLEHQYAESDNDTSFNALSHDDYDYTNSFKQNKNDTKSGLKKRPRLDKDEMHVNNPSEEKNTFSTEKSFENIPEIIRTVKPLQTENDKEHKTNQEPNSILIDGENKNKTNDISNHHNLHGNDLNHLSPNLMNNTETSRQFPSDTQFEDGTMTIEPSQESSTEMISPEDSGSTEYVPNLDRDHIHEVLGTATDNVPTKKDDVENQKIDITDLPPTLATLVNKKVIDAVKNMESTTEVMGSAVGDENIESVMDVTTIPEVMKNNMMKQTTTTETIPLADIADSESSSTNVMDSSTTIVELIKPESSSTERDSQVSKVEDSTEVLGVTDNPKDVTPDSLTKNTSSGRDKGTVDDDNRFANDLHSFATLAESNMSIGSPITTESNVNNIETTTETKIKAIEKGNDTVKEVSDIENNGSVTESVVYISDDNKETTKKSVAHEDNVFGDSSFNDYTEDDVENKLLFAHGLRKEKTTLTTERNDDGNIKMTTQSMLANTEEEKVINKDDAVNSGNFFEKDISVVPLKPEKKTNKKSNKYSENAQDFELSQFDKKSGDKNQKYDKETSQKSDRFGLAAGFDYNSDPYKMFDEYEGLDLNKDTENPIKILHTTQIPENAPETTVFDDSKPDESSTLIPKVDASSEGELVKMGDDKKVTEDNSNEGKADERVNKAIEKDSKINVFVKPLAEGLEPAYNNDVKITTKPTYIEDVSVTTIKTPEIMSSDVTVATTTETRPMVNISEQLGGFPTIPVFSKCASGQFQCTNGTSRDGSYCVSASTKCDSVDDCTDGSDEAGCVDQGCPGNFQCANGQCLKRHLVCNDIVDCNDGSDELECDKWQCQFDEFQCPTGRCIPVLWQCDGKPDCSNHTDEFNCQTACANNEYLCPEGWCIPMTWRCNGVPECSSGEDEKLCDCSVDQFKCNTGGCVDKHAMCDGIDQCPDASDEWDCIRLHSDTMQLEIRSSNDAWSPVCQDNWDSLWSDRACQNLGYSKSTFTEYKHRSAVDSVYSLKSSALTAATKDKSPKIAAALANGTTCAADAMVEISCQDFTCGSHSLAGGVAARVVGGDRAANGQWPSVALLYHTRHKSSCTASIVSPKWLLSSYHCLHQKDKQMLPQSWVAFGGGSMFETDKPETQIKEIRSIIPYPQVKYNQFQYNNDIVLIELASALTFNRNIGAICLPDKEIEPRQLCVTAGWGYTSPGEINFSQYLHYLPVPTIDLKECNSSKHYAGFITGDEICAGFTDSEKSPCYNDEGAPLMCISEGGVWELQGVLSYHSNCGRGYHPSIFSSITAVRSWVEKTIGSRFERKSTFNVR